jgi:PEP-CTERM motif
VDTLGYTFDYGVVRPADSVYRLSVTFPHTANSVSFNFSGSGMQALSNESWGIDNVVVSDAIPEPSTLLLVAFGTIGMLRYGCRRTYQPHKL